LLVFVDEAQFLNVHQVEELLSITIQAVICYGLRIDFQTRGF